MPALYSSGGQKGCRSDAGQEDTQYKAFYRVRRAVKLVIWCRTGGQEYDVQTSYWAEGHSRSRQCRTGHLDANLVQSTRMLILHSIREHLGCRACAGQDGIQVANPSSMQYGRWCADMVIGEDHSGCRSCTGEEDTGYMV